MSCNTELHLMSKTHFTSCKSYLQHKMEAQKAALKESKRVARRVLLNSDDEENEDGDDEEEDEEDEEEGEVRD